VAQLLWGDWGVFYLGAAERGYNGFGVTLIIHIHTSSLRITGTVLSRAIERQSISITNPKQRTE